MKAPEEANDYYNLPEGAKMRDLILSIRADEACHREVNHHCGDIPSWDRIEHAHVTIKDEYNLVLETLA